MPAMRAALQYRYRQYLRASDTPRGKLLPASFLHITILVVVINIVLAIFNSYPYLRSTGQKSCSPSFHITHSRYVSRLNVGVSLLSSSLSSFSWQYLTPVIGEHFPLYRHQPLICVFIPSIVKYWGCKFQLSIYNFQSRPEMRQFPI